MGRNSAIAFVAGFAVMNIELLGVRLLAPSLGSSVLVWTNVISVILVALALGAWVGGVLADRHPSLAVVSYFLLGTGAWAMLLAAYGRFATWLFASLPIDLAAPIASLALLAVPAFFLGGVSPGLYRLATQDVEHAGHVAGKLSAMGTLGSLAGTYLTGYFLLPRFSVSSLLLWLGIALCALGAIMRFRAKRRMGRIGLLVGLLVLQAALMERLVFGTDIPSAYAAVSVMELPFHGEMMRELRVNTALEAVAPPGNPAESAADYVRSFRAVDLIVPDPKRALVLGGGAFHAQRDIVRRHPEAHVDTVEIDPAVITAARSSFSMTDDPRITVMFADARPAMRTLNPGYDVIQSDVFLGDTVPWYLLTRESMADARRLLNTNGVFVSNLLMPLTGNGAGIRYRENIFATIKTSFAWTFGVSIRNGASDNGPSNVLVFAGNGKEPDHAAIVTAVNKEIGSDAAREVPILGTGRVWTDDFGTADYESVEMVREAGKN